MLLLILLLTFVSISVLLFDDTEFKSWGWRGGCYPLADWYNTEKGRQYRGFRASGVNKIQWVVVCAKPTPMSSTNAPVPLCQLLC